MCVTFVRDLCLSISHGSSTYQSNIRIKKPLGKEKRWHFDMTRNCMPSHRADILRYYVIIAGESKFGTRAGI